MYICTLYPMHNISVLHSYTCSYFSCALVLYLRKDKWKRGRFPYTNTWTNWNKCWLWWMLWPNFLWFLKEFRLNFFFFYWFVCSSYTRLKSKTQQKKRIMKLNFVIQVICVFGIFVCIHNTHTKTIQMIRWTH